LVGLVRLHLLTGERGRENAKRYLSLPDGGEASYIMDIFLLERQLAEHYAYLRKSAYLGTSHELYCVLAGTIEVMTALKYTTHVFFRRALKLFDAFLFHFAGKINIRTPGLIPMDLNILEGFEELGPGITFYSIDLEQVGSGNGNHYNFVHHCEGPEKPEEETAEDEDALPVGENSEMATPDPAEQLTPESLPATGDGTAPNERIALLLETEAAVWEGGDYIAVERKGDDWRAGNLKVIVRLLTPLLEHF
jgi:hypothetical protein